MTRIKFCGLTRPEDAERAASLGACCVGVILTDSIRQREPLAAREIFEAAPGVNAVGVFRRRPVEEILSDALTARADTLQLHGPFTAEEIERLRHGFDGAIWSVIPVETSGQRLDTAWMQIADAVDALVLDTSAGGVTGGTGRPFDWAEAASFVDSIADRTTIVLAGGLTPSNVGAAIAILRPSVVDVSSGVETRPGLKDPLLMRAFAEAVASASME